MSGTGKNLIFVGRASAGSNTINPNYLEGTLEGAAVPGIVVEMSSSAGVTNFGTFDPTSGRFPLIVDLNAIKQGGVDDAWASGDTAVAFQPTTGECFNLRTVATFTAARGTPLTITSAGQVKVAVATETVFCFLDEMSVSALAINSLVRVRWAAGTGQVL